MKKTMVLLMMAAVIFSVSGCAYMNVKVPLDKDLNQTTLGSKTGQASSQSVLWLFAWGDSGTKAAAENGNITTINHMDAQLKSILFGLYTKNTVIVYGD